jgi:hypothetical protein
MMIDTMTPACVPFAIFPHPPLLPVSNNTGVLLALGVEDVGSRKLLSEVGLEVEGFDSAAWLFVGEAVEVGVLEWGLEAVGIAVACPMSGAVESSAICDSTERCDKIDSAGVREV